MSLHRRQALMEAPLPSVWGLVGDPRRYPEWWPLIVEARGERLEEGLEYVQVMRTPGGRTESHFLVERLDDLREVRVRCQLSGTFIRWQLTEARDDTFVDIEIGIDPTGKALRYRVLDLTVAKALHRRWTEQALDSLRDALARSAA